MAAVTSSDIQGIWRALSGAIKTPGWQTIDLLKAGTCHMKLARHSPGDEEAVLFVERNELSSGPCAPESWVLGFECYQLLVEDLPVGLAPVCFFWKDNWVFFKEFQLSIQPNFVA